MYWALEKTEERNISAWYQSKTGSDTRQTHKWQQKTESPPKEEE